MMILHNDQARQRHILADSEDRKASAQTLSVRVRLQPFPLAFSPAGSAARLSGPAARRPSHWVLWPRTPGRVRAVRRSSSGSSWMRPCVSVREFFGRLARGQRSATGGRARRRAGPAAGDRPTQHEQVRPPRRANDPRRLAARCARPATGRARNSLRHRDKCLFECACARLLERAI